MDDRRDLVSLFRTNFRQSEKFYGLFGFVLSHLPEADLKAIAEVKNLVFYLMRSSGGSVEKVDLIRPFDSQEIVVVCFDASSPAPCDSKIMGMVAHELAHVRLGHYDDGPDSSGIKLNDDAEWTRRMRKLQSREPEADALATSWGFGPEIRMMRGY